MNSEQWAGSVQGEAERRFTVHMEDNTMISNNTGISSVLHVFMIVNLLLPHPIYSRSLDNVIWCCLIITLIRCCRNLTLVHTNKPVMKVVLLYIILLKVTEAIDNVKWRLTVQRRYTKGMIPGGQSRTV